MQAVGPGPGADVRTRPAPPPRRRARRIILLVLGLAVVLFTADSIRFVHLIEVNENASPRNADGIVVLTGGPFRIGDALDLLAAGRGQRLLISGVNPLTRSREIASLVPEHQRWFNCCVDLEHSSTNTIGNALETRRWVKGRNFKSLIVVTANFHMPRAMVELAHQLPDVALVPYAVVSDKVKVETWWENPETARLLFLEYLKYILARVRMVLPSAA